MAVRLESTTKVIEFLTPIGPVPARIWEGETESEPLMPPGEHDDDLEDDDEVDPADADDLDDDSFDDIDEED